MKIRLLTTLLMLFAIPIVSVAQDDDSKEEDKPEISFLKFQRSKFILLDAEKFPIKRGLKKNHMEALLEGNSDALKHYNRFRTLRTMKHVTRGVGLAAIVTGLALVPEYDDVGWGIMTGGVLFMLGVQLPIAISAGSQAGKAVDDHNTIMSKNKEKYSLHMGVTGNGIGLVLNF